MRRHRDDPPRRPGAFCSRRCAAEVPWDSCRDPRRRHAGRPLTAAGHGWPRRRHVPARARVHWAADPPRSASQHMRCNRVRKTEPVRIATWNVNSVGARLPRLNEWLELAQPDVLCLQETKCTSDSFPSEGAEALGYEVAANGDGRWNG